MYRSRHRKVQISFLFESSYVCLFSSEDFIPDFPYEPEAYDEDMLR